MIDDAERCYRIVCSRDPRFDGWFFTGVTSTGIFCRPSCPARTPVRDHVTFHPSAAAAVAHGYRACRRCRPDASPGSPEWQGRADVAARAMRLIADGVVDREGVGGLARRLGYSQRQLHRVVVAELGAGPLALARVQRAHTARLLLETSTLPVTEIAHAAGFASVRQFNETVRSVYGTTPTELRRRLGTGPTDATRPAGGGTARGSAAGTMTVRLPVRVPVDVVSLLAFLGERSVPGSEEMVGGTYRRVLELPHGPATVALSDAADDGVAAVSCTLTLSDVADVGPAVQRCRRLLDLDADPVAVDELLGADPVLGDLVGRAPGQRVPGHVDGAELAMRAVLGQQVSVAGARTLAGRLVAAHGRPLPPSLRRHEGGLTHGFPSPATIAELDPATLPMPRARAGALVNLARALASGDVVLDAGTDRSAVTTALLAQPGIGPWTASYIAMRALGDPDAFLPTDLGVRHAVERLGHPGAPRAVAELAEAWRPWRSYAVVHLWRSLADPTPKDPTCTPQT